MVASTGSRSRRSVGWDRESTACTAVPTSPAPTTRCFTLPRIYFGQKNVSLVALVMVAGPSPNCAIRNRTRRSLALWDFHE